MNPCVAESLCRRSCLAHARVSACVYPVALVLAALAAQPVVADQFCVSTPTQLQAALDLAGSNGEDDHIRVRVGTYTAVHPGFIYAPEAGEDHDIKISGGWMPYILGPCTLQDEQPWATILDGNGSARIMLLEVLPAGVDVRIERLVFLGGNFGSFSPAGLDIHYLDGATGDVTVERNVFLNNTSALAAGLGILGRGSTLAVVNNLFLLNQASSNLPAAYVVNSVGSEGTVVFTNNTVLGNELGDTPSEDASAVYLLSGRVLAANNNFWDNAGYDLYCGGTGNRRLFNNNHESFRLTGTELLMDNISVQPVYQGGLLNFTPVRGSPLVDAGTEPRGIDPGWYLADADLNGSTRKVGAHVDIGAYENETIFDDGFEPQGPFGGEPMTE